MNKDELFNLTVSKIKNKKVSNSQKATIRQLIEAGMICHPVSCVNQDLINQLQAGSDLGPALGAPEKQSPSFNRLKLLVKIIICLSLFLLMVAMGLGVILAAHYLA